MKNIWKWIKDSHRLQHLLGGIAIGALSSDWYCAGLAGISTAGAMEFKDYQWGGKPDIIDFIITLTGVFIGFGFKFWIL